MDRKSQDRSAPLGFSLEIIDNLSKTAYRANVALFEALKKKGIFADVVINDSPSMIGSMEPAKEYDVIYLIEPSAGSLQMFYSSTKHGRQVLAYDRSGPNFSSKVRAFTEAVQLLAIRD